MDDPPEAIPVDHGPSDSFHPIYDSVVEWLNAEARRPDPGTAPIIRNGRRRPVMPAAAKKRVKA